MRMIIGWSLLAVGATFAVLCVGCVESRANDWIIAASFELYMAMSLGISGLSMVRKSAVLQPARVT